MLLEWLHQFAVTSPPWARRLGLHREHVAIAARRRRVGPAWDAHLAASRAVILQGADRCRPRRRALVIGAGDCFDIPVAELAERFDEVVLADVVIGRGARRWARRRPGRVRCALWDATGCLARLGARPRPVDLREVPRVFANADPGPPPCGTPDLVVSANCLSQLGLVPGHYLGSDSLGEAWPQRCAQAAARRHLAWLAAHPGTRVLIADLARLDLDAGGRELKREYLMAGLGLRPPDRSWRWDLAPIPEWSRRFHRVHDVGAWIDGAREDGR